VAAFLAEFPATTLHWVWPRAGVTAVGAVRLGQSC